MVKIVGGVWNDDTGRTRLTIIKAATNPCTVLAALQAKSNAGVLYNWDGTIDPAIGAPTLGAQYAPVAAAARLVFQTAGGLAVYLTLPAPQLGIFMADGKTVDPAQVAAIIAAALGNVSDTNGDVVTSYLGGFLAPTRNDLTPLG